MNYLKKFENATEEYKETVDRWHNLPDYLREELSKLNFSAFQIIKVEKNKYTEVTVKDLDLEVDDIKTSSYLARILNRGNINTLFFY